MNAREGESRLTLRQSARRVGLGLASAAVVSLAACRGIQAEAIGGSTNTSNSASSDVSLPQLGSHVGETVTTEFPDSAFKFGSGRGGVSIASVIVENGNIHVMFPPRLSSKIEFITKDPASSARVTGSVGRESDGTIDIWATKVKEILTGSKQAQRTTSIARWNSPQLSRRPISRGI